MKKLIAISLILSSTSLYADIYDDYIKIDQGFNQKFIRNIAESRAHEGKRKGDKYNNNYLEVDGNEEFKKAVEEGKFNNNIPDSDSLQKQYVYRDIKNVNIDDNDLEGLQGDTLNLGSSTDGGNIVQSLNIEDSTIDTDRELTAGVTTSSSDASDITSLTQIKDSKLSGGESNQDSKINTSKYFDN